MTPRPTIGSTHSKDSVALPHATGRLPEVPRAGGQEVEEFLIPRWIRVPRAPTVAPALLFGPERVKPNQQGSHRAIGWERGVMVRGWMVGGGEGTGVK